MSLFGEHQQLAWIDQYRSVITSSAWKAKRSRLMRVRGGCERCGSNDQLEIHHKTYDRLGQERDEDLEVLCAHCHRCADRERASESARRSEDALMEARFLGWAERRYGRTYVVESLLDDEDLWVEFEEWLEKVNTE